MTELDFLPAPLNSRFQTYSSPMSSPGKCSVCGAVDRPVVDFGVTIQYYGAVVFCFVCMTEAARVIDMVPRSELTTAEEGLTQSFNSVLDKKELVAISRERYSTILMAISGLSDLLFSASASSDDLVGGEAREEQPSLFADTTESVFGTNEPVEQKHDAPVRKGRTNISSRTSDGTSEFSL